MSARATTPFHKLEHKTSGTYSYLPRIAYGDTVEVKNRANISNTLVGLTEGPISPNYKIDFTSQRNNFGYFAGIVEFLRRYAGYELILNYYGLNRKYHGTVTDWSYAMVADKVKKLTDAESAQYYTEIATINNWLVYDINPFLTPNLVRTSYYDISITFLAYAKTSLSELEITNSRLRTFEPVAIS